MELWKDIKGYEGRYQISSYGRVKCFYRNKDGDELKLKTDRYGYKVAKLTKHGKRQWITVHRLVAMAFIPPFNGEQVNHIDANKTNNNVDNLEWCSNLENIRHARRLGLFRNAEIASANRRKPVYCISKNSGLILYFNSLTEAGTALNTSAGSVGSVLDSSKHSIHGYRVISA